MDLFQYDYKILKEKFIENYNMNHLTIDLLDAFQESNYDEAINFIVEKFEKDFTSKKLQEIFKGIN